MKSMIINAAKSWAFNSTCFASTLFGFNELEGNLPVYIYFCAIIGILTLSAVMAFGVEASIDKIKKIKGKWNGIGKENFL